MWGGLSENLKSCSTCVSVHHHYNSSLPSLNQRCTWLAWSVSDHHGMVFNTQPKKWIGLGWDWIDLWMLGCQEHRSAVLIKCPQCNVVDLLCWNYKLPFPGQFSAISDQAMVAEWNATRFADAPPDGWHKPLLHIKALIPIVYLTTTAY